MNNKKAINLLELQINKIHDISMNREEWLNSTIPVLINIFPVSSSMKITQIRSINDAQNQITDISGKDKIDIRKRKAERYLRNYIEEIALLDVENRSDKIEDLFRSFVFWAILISAMLISFLGGLMLDSQEWGL